MNRSSFIALTAVVGLGFGGVLNVAGSGESIDQLVADANKSIALAASVVDEARIAIDNGKQLLATIPDDSPLLAEVAGMLPAVKENWTLAVSALAINPMVSLKPGIKKRSSSVELIGKPIFFI